MFAANDRRGSVSDTRNDLFAQQVNKCGTRHFNFRVEDAVKIHVIQSNICDLNRTRNTLEIRAAQHLKKQMSRIDKRTLKWKRN